MRSATGLWLRAGAVPRDEIEGPLSPYEEDNSHWIDRAGRLDRAGQLTPSEERIQSAEARIQEWKAVGAAVTT